MDPFSMAFYAVVCGCLSAFAPSLGGVVQRLTAGAIVGVIAAVLVPWLRGAIGIGY